MTSKVQYLTPMAIALANAADKDLAKQTKVDHNRWVARAVADRVVNTRLGVKTRLSTVVIK